MQETGQTAYQLARGAGPLAPVLYASPHSGRIYPEDMLVALSAPLIDLRRTEDAFVDDLFAGVISQGASLLKARYARAYVDLNRNPAELDRTMFANGLPRPALSHSSRVDVGLGVLPRIGASGQPIYARKLTLEEGHRRLSHVHDGYHGALEAELKQLRAVWGVAVLIDCHSMPSHQSGRSNLPDIVLGDRYGTSCSGWLIEAAEQAFRRHGYKTARNAPYAGGYTTQRYGLPHQHIHAMQIELNRSLYLDEAAVVQSSNHASFKADLAAITAEIIMVSRNVASPPLAAE